MKSKIIVIKLRDIFIISSIVLVFIVVLPLIVVGTDKDHGEGTKENENKGVQVNEETLNKLYGDTVKIYITKDNRVIEIPIEEYIKGVVASEMPANFQEEALKAQAVAARTYTLSKLLEKCSMAHGGDLCDTIHCQVYTEKNEKISQWGKDKGNEYWNKINKAVEDTKGKVLTYDNNLVMRAQYFAISGGKTENIADVFGTDEPYLKSVVSIGDNEAPKYKTNVSLDVNEFVKKINEAYPKAKLTSKNINAIKIVERTEGGSVKGVSIGNDTIKGTDFRKTFQLNSANFKIDINKSKVNIECLGYGHGVGMSQWGANAMAKEGKGYEDILKHYYTGVNIVKLKSSET